MSGWQDYLQGALRGHVEVVCDGRNPGDHRECAIGTWWYDDAPGLHCYAGRPTGDRRRDDDGTGQSSRPAASGGWQHHDRAVCPRCGLDVLMMSERWRLAIDRRIAAGLVRVSLRALSRAA